jgi:rhodanese-related sulfurtransferase
MKKTVLIHLLLLVIVGLSAQVFQFERLTADTFSTRLDELNKGDHEFQLIDIRTYPEFIQGHIEGASQLDFYASDFFSRLEELDKQRIYLIYCRSGNRTNQTLKIMQQLGFENVSDLKDGINSWKEAGFGVVE